MAKFSKGDKVESVKTGAKGIVDEVYGDEKYAVLFDGATNPDRVEGFQIKAANAKACNGKFKVGDSVRLVKGPAPSVGDFGKVVNVYTLTEDMAKSMGFGDYVGQDIVTFFGKGGKHIVPEAWVVAANSASVLSTNAVVQNAINARRARNAINFNGASAKVRKALEGRLEKLVQKFKNDLNAVVADVGREYKKYQSIEPDSASLIKEVEYWIDSLNDAISQTW